MLNSRLLIASLFVMLMAFVMGLSPALAQVESFDPDAVIDGDLARDPAQVYDPAPVDEAPALYDHTDSEIAPDLVKESAVDGWNAQELGAPPVQAEAAPPTYQKDDLIGAAEGVFGKGAAGLAGILEDILKKQGEPGAYITGREAGGAIAIGLRYGSGQLHHKIEGNRKVYWTGPSLGFDLGGNAAKAFVLVYNLHDSQELYERFGSGEGQAYLVGGFHVSYMRKGDVVLIPVRMGAGLRLGVNIGYMKFSEKQRWLPF